MTEADKSWEKFLHPETLRTNLISISLFITAFEMFKAQVIKKPETFFCNGFDENRLTISKDYASDVLSKNKSKLYASLLWLKEMDAIDQSDIDVFDSIRKHRNEVAHEPLEFIASHTREFDISKFQSLISLLKKIEVWWLINYEIAIDPDMLPEDADIDGIVPGPIWSLQLMLDIALGNEPVEGYYYNSFMQRKA